jgi:hypothetical protein
MNATMVEPHCLIEGIDSRDSFQVGFEAQGNGFVGTAGHHLAGGPALASGPSVSVKMLTVEFTK